MKGGVLLLLLLAGPERLDELKHAYADAVAEADWREVAAVAGAIAALADENARWFLQEELWTATERAHCRGLIRALAFRRDDESRDFLDSHLEHEDPYCRAIVLEAWEKLDPGRAVAVSSRLLTTDPDKRVRRKCVEIMARRGEARTLFLAAAELSNDEQLAVLEIVRGMKSEQLLGLASLLDHRDRDTRLFVVRIFAARRDERFRPALQKASRDRDRTVRLVAIAGVDGIDDPGFKSALRKRLDAMKGFDARWEFFDAIVRAGVEDRNLAVALASEARSGPKYLRAKAAEALGTAGRDSAVSILAPLLSVPKPWQVPIGAARGLANTRAREAVPVLIRALDRSGGRLQQEIAEALESLTGQPFGRLVKSWEKWWERRGEHFRVPAVPPAPWEEETAAGDRRYAFYGIDLVSEAVAFVCDISGSMEGKPLARLKRELGIVLKRFPPKGRFNLVFFETRVHQWAPRLRQATRKVKAAALAYIAERQTTGATNLWGGMLAALQDERVDTIVLLTDGSPTAGPLQDLRQIRARFLEMNRKRMILLHVVAIGVDAPELRHMARASGGTYARK